LLKNEFLKEVCEINMSITVWLVTILNKTWTVGMSNYGKA